MQANTNDFTPYTQAERDQFVEDLNKSRARHCQLVDRIITACTSGSLKATDPKAAGAVKTIITELYTLQNAKPPWGVRPVINTPELLFEMEVIKKGKGE